MKLIREASESEMIATFLEAEIDSKKWSGSFRNLNKFRLTDAMVRDPDWNNPNENRRRAELLASYRGWGRETLLFQGWPQNLKWSFVTMSRDDLVNVRCIKEKDWYSFTRGSLIPKVGAQRIASGDSGIPENIRVDAIKEISQQILDGEELLPLIMIGREDGTELVVVEGNTRLTAYELSATNVEINVLIGTAPIDELKKWMFYPSEAIYWL